MELMQARELAREAMDAHGLSDWGLRFDRAVRRAGACRYGDRVISLSAPLTRLHDEADVRDTVLHEIAHALAGPRAGHGPRWRETARRLGASPQRCLPEDAPRIPGRWLGVCPQGHTIDRHRRPGRVISCRRCAPGFRADAVFTWTYDGEPVVMGSDYQSELASLSRAGAGSDAGAGASGGASAGATYGETPPARLAVGSRARITAGGRWSGQIGQVIKRGRTRYHLRCGRHVVTVPFALVEEVRG